MKKPDKLNTPILVVCENYWTRRYIFNVYYSFHRPEIIAHSKVRTVAIEENGDVTYFTTNRHLKHLLKKDPQSIIINSTEFINRYL